MSSGRLLLVDGVERVGLHQAIADPNFEVRCAWVVCDVGAWGGGVRTGAERLHTHEHRQAQWRAVVRLPSSPSGLTVHVCAWQAAQHRRP